MKCLVVGAGNAGRPAARILNYVGHDVKITDEKELEEFPDDVKETLLKMEEEGVVLQLGLPNPDFAEIDSVYVSPTIPLNSPKMNYVRDNGLKIIKNTEISEYLDDVIDIDVIGVTGTVGKTSTTHILSEIFKSAGYKVWTCSSKTGNLLSEVIVDGIISGKHLDNDIAVLELPHGTIRLMSQVKLKIGVLTNVYSDHLSEFDNSVEQYMERKLLIVGSSDVLVSNTQCKEIVESQGKNALFYSVVNDNCNVSGHLEGDKVTIKYSIRDNCGLFKTDFNLRGYYFENSIAATTAALSYGLDEEAIKKGLSNFNGIPGHLEYIGKYSDREIHFDAAFVPEGIVSTMEQFKGPNLIVLIDNPDSTNPRNKQEIGKIVGEYAKVIIASGFNETTKITSMKSADEVLEGAEEPDVIKIAVEDMVKAGELSIKNSVPGDVILHIGPGAITNYEDLKAKMMTGIEKGCKKYV